MDSMAVPAASLLSLAVDEIEQVVHPHGELEVLAIERILVMVETEPEKGLERFGEEVDPSRVCLSGNALEDQKAIYFLDQPFPSGFPDGQECAQHIPAVGSGRQAKIGDGHDVVHVQVAEQLALRITAITIRHDTSSFVGALAADEKAPADWQGR